MIYRYTVLNGNERIDGQIEADSLLECEEKLISRGYSIVKIDKVSKLNLENYKNREFKNEELYILFYQLHILIESKISIPEAVLILSNTYAKSKAMHLKNIYKNIAGGMKLSESIGDEKVCPKFAVNMIKIGEESAQLDLVLKELSNYYFEKEIFKKKLYTTLTYPAILFISTILIMNFLVLYILPTFSNIFAESGVELPFITRILIKASNILRLNFIYFFSAIILIIASALIYIRTDSGKLKLEKILLKSKLYRVIQSYNFIAMMNFLLNSKVIVSEALKISRESLDNLHMKAEIYKAVDKLYGGVDLAESLKGSKFFDNISLSILRVGEKSSSIEKVMNSLKKYYEKKLDMDSKKFLAFIEPIIILILSIFVGFVVLSIALPMFDVVNYIG